MRHLLLTLAFPIAGFANASYELSSCQDLASINNDMSGVYSLTQDIDCENQYIDHIGDYDRPFTGVLNGNGHTIRNLRLHPFEDIDGLFVRLDGARIENITFENYHMDMFCAEYIGLLAGIIENSYLTDVTIQSSEITADFSLLFHGAYHEYQVGMIAGKIDKSNINKLTIKDSKFDVKGVTDPNQSETPLILLGMIAGTANDLVLQNSEFLNTSITLDAINSYDHISGVAVEVNKNFSMKNNRFENIVLSGASTTSGIASYMYIKEADIQGNAFKNMKIGGVLRTYGMLNELSPSLVTSVATIKNNYFQGKLSCVNDANICYSVGLADVFNDFKFILENNYVAAIFDHSTQVSTFGVAPIYRSLETIRFPFVQNNFWDDEIAGFDFADPVMPGTKGLTTQAMQTQSTFTDAGWDFETVWTMGEDGYPELR